MPQLVDVGAILNEVEFILGAIASGKRWAAYERCKFLVDSLLPFTAVASDDSKLPVKYGHLKICSEIEDFDDLECLQKEGKAGKKVNLVKIAQDTEKARQFMEKGVYGPAEELLRGIAGGLGMRIRHPEYPSAYDDSGVLGELVLKARCDVKKAVKRIVSGDFAEDFVPAGECYRLLESYIDRAYGLGREEAAIDAGETGAKEFFRKNGK